MLHPYSNLFPAGDGCLTLPHVLLTVSCLLLLLLLRCLSYLHDTMFPVSAAALPVPSLTSCSCMELSSQLFFLGPPLKKHRKFGFGPQRHSGVLHPYSNLFPAGAGCLTLPHVLLTVSWLLLLLHCLSYLHDTMFPVSAAALAVPWLTSCSCMELSSQLFFLGPPLKKHRKFGFGPQRCRKSFVQFPPMLLIAFVAAMINSALAWRLLEPVWNRMESTIFDTLL